MTLITFEIQDGEYSYEQYSIFTKELTEKEMIEEVYGIDGIDYRQCKVTSSSKITDKEAKTLRKFGIAYIN
tara:strand:+ start:460 stop:672 length:213 start_codon:yes stop_codon:yes gene_type:complete